jgi:nucleotide-binding universal stress UspA family protein
MFERILMPTDGSELSLAAAERAVELARIARAPLLVAYVQEPYAYSGVGAASSEGLNEHLAQGQRVAAAAFARVRALGEGCGVAVETVVLEGSSPAAQIVEAARGNGADQIVMASHGRTGAVRLLLGSVASEVIAKSPVSVLIAK